MLISIILPAYNEQENLPVLLKRLTDVSAQLPAYDFEFIFVDDCSSDETPTTLNDLKKGDQRIHIIRFARNCGSHAAVEAGLHYCRGDAAIVLATDLQDPPEIIPRLIEPWQKGFKTVWGVRQKREGESLSTIACSRAYYFLMNHLTDVVQPPSGADVFLIDRAVVEAVKRSPEKNSEIFMLIAWLGFSQTQIMYIKEARYAGTSKWNFTKLLKLFFDSLISFSYVPLRCMSLMGVIFALVGLVYGAYVFINAFRDDTPIPGFSSLMIVILLLGGFQMSMMGMLGEYLWRTYDETRKRPKYVIEKNTLVDKNPPDGIKG
jgi:dolichol-phosphate mannosyltransferase